MNLNLQFVFLTFFPPLSSRDVMIGGDFCNQAHYMNFLRKHAVICVCSQVNAEVSSALHQLCLPQQPVKAACVVCEGADSDDPQQCTCKRVFLVHTYIFLHLCKNICYTKSLYWLYFCPDCSMIIHKACCDSAPLCVKVSVCVLKI